MRRQQLTTYIEKAENQTIITNQKHKKYIIMKCKKPYKYKQKEHEKQEITKYLNNVFTATGDRSLKTTTVMIP